MEYYPDLPLNFCFGLIHNFTSPGDLCKTALLMTTLESLLDASRASLRTLALVKEHAEPQDYVVVWAVRELADPKVDPLAARAAHAHEAVRRGDAPAGRGRARVSW